MERRLITVRADKNISDMTDITLPFIYRYAYKCNANVEILDKDIEGLHRHYRIMRLYDLFDNYDKILNIDADILIKHDCPNIFNMIDSDTVACIYEDKGTRQEHRRNTIKLIQQIRGNVNWSYGYINTGFILFSKQHKDIFDYTDKNLWEEPEYDDIELAYRMHKSNIKIQELSYKFNHMTMFSEAWNNYANRFNSYVIHYAGVGLFAPCGNRTEMIRQDSCILNRLEKYCK